MNKLKLSNQTDFKVFLENSEHPNSRSAIDSLRGINTPLNYPTVICWYWDTDEYTSQDFINYIYIYPKDLD